MTEHETELIHIITVQDTEYEEAVDAANANGGSIDAVIEYLAQWDQGDETDADSSSYYGTRLLSDLEKLSHSLYEGTHGGLRYWLLVDHPLGLYSLYRAPLDSTDHDDQSPAQS